VPALDWLATALGLAGALALVVVALMVRRARSGFTATGKSDLAGMVADSSRLRLALDALSQGVVIQDQDGRISFRNAHAHALLDSRNSDLLAAKAVEEQLGSSEVAIPSERILELYGPPRRTLVVRTVPLSNGQGPLGVVAVLDDISQRSRLESIRRDFVANVSHELKTPIAALGLLAETLADSDDPEDSRRLAQRMQSEAFRVSRVIEDLLDLSRIEAQERPPRQRVQLDGVMAEATQGVAETAAARNILLDTVGLPCGLAVNGDRRQLLSAVHNLLENAIKYSDQSSSVVLELQSQGGWVEVAVRDHGIGIPAGDLERVFERFYRVDQARSRATGGTGLGLAIVRHVAVNHGGEVRVSSREGEGSVFTLRLPLAGEPA
jgi:two-component system, OmpR family, sensor histidine kinase SenX3